MGRGAGAVQQRDALGIGPGQPGRSGGTPAGVMRVVLLMRAGLAVVVGSRELVPRRVLAFDGAVDAGSHFQHDYDDEDHGHEGPEDDADDQDHRPWHGLARLHRTVVIFILGAAAAAFILILPLGRFGRFVEVPLFVVGFFVVVRRRRRRRTRLTDRGQVRIRMRQRQQRRRRVAVDGLLRADRGRFGGRVEEVGPVLGRPVVVVVVLVVVEVVVVLEAGGGRRGGGRGRRARIEVSETIVVVVWKKRKALIIRSGI